MVVETGAFRHLKHHEIREAANDSNPSSFPVRFLRGAEIYVALNFQTD